MNIHSLSLAEWVVLAVGFAGQALFSARFLVQWIASERIGRSTVPVAFWYLSLAGGATLFAYAAYREDAVFMVGQGFGIFVYLRNLWLIHHADRVGAVSGRAEPQS
ncbi:MAG: lipid-A-disaccharide synthase N-terminal domain-containing protein [Burkholderiaceae bacterium]